jgi:hypothetical protein
MDATLRGQAAELRPKKGSALTWAWSRERERPQRLRPDCEQRGAALTFLLTDRDPR